MPVAKLFVEGELDEELLIPICAGRPVVEAAKSSKNELAPRVRTERSKQKTPEGRASIQYLRDRDFDYLPLPDTSVPAIDQEQEGTVLGRRWCRHEIESYMLDPAIVISCLAVARDEYESALLGAAKTIVNYQAARWTIGQARAQLPKVFKFSTRPEPPRREFFLPSDTSRERMETWALQHSAAFLDATRTHLSADVVQTAFNEHLARFDAGFLASVENVLLWFSGKDLMAALGDWPRNLSMDGPGKFRAKLRDWMRDNPARVLALLPEWAALVKDLRA